MIISEGSALLSSVAMGHYFCALIKRSIKKKKKNCILTVLRDEVRVETPTRHRELSYDAFHARDGEIILGR